MDAKTGEQVVLNTGEVVGKATGPDGEFIDTVSGKILKERKDDPEVCEEKVEMKDPITGKMMTKLLAFKRVRDPQTGDVSLVRVPEKDRLQDPLTGITT